MKILYIPLETFHDFQCDTMNWGLRSLNKTEKIQLDKTFNNEKLYKKTTANSHISSHYTYYRHWEEEIPHVNIEDIDYKIKHKYYDLIIIQDGLHDIDYGRNKYRGQIDYLYKIYKNNLFIVDGEDGGDGEYMKKLKNYPEIKYFRRELTYTLKYEHNTIFPINFGFPDELINENNYEKTQLISSIIPGLGSTYITSSEVDYYNEYRKSKFAYTFSKCGWDCLRHLEIIFNKSLPIFLDLEFCPNKVLYFYPKFELLEILNKMCNIKYDQYNYDNIHSLGKIRYWQDIILNNLIEIKNLKYYDEIQNKIYNKCKKYLTCNAIVNYVLEHYE